MKIHGTAKGGALATKDFGVAFGGAPACTEEYYTLPDETLIERNIGVAREGVAFQPTSGNAIFEKTVSSVTVSLDDDNRSPDETISVRCRNSSGAVVATFGQMNAATLTSSKVEYTFDTNQITLSSGDMITLEYPITSGNPIAASVYKTDTINYVSNANTLASTGGVITTWATWSDFGYFWNWFKVIYCE